ncbi:MAG: hypothetical protein ACTHLK_23005 [Brucella intermedia]
MRSTTITVHNDHRLEIFIEEKKEGFEFWTVGTIKGKRMVLDHHLTHDDIEGRLHYERRGDVQWHDAAPSEIPSEKHSNAKEMEGGVKRGTFIDQPSVVSHLGFGSIDLVPTDRKVMNAAKKAILGCWSDGQATITLAPDSKLMLSGLGPDHVLNRGQSPTAPERNWWNFDSWQLWFMNMQQKVGQRIGVLRVSDNEFTFTALSLTAWPTYLSVS